MSTGSVQRLLVCYPESDYPSGTVFPSPASYTRAQTHTLTDAPFHKRQSQTSPEFWSVVGSPGNIIISYNVQEYEMKTLIK